MKKFLKSIIIASVALVSATGCDYLDIVPDNTIELTNLFETKEKAYRALSDVYSYMPDVWGVHSSYWLAGDEWCERLDSQVADTRSYCPGSKILRDWSNASQPILGFWDGSGKAQDLYEGIRICNIFIKGLSPDIPDLTIYEYNDWIAQAKMVKAYYHYFLLSWYGPIIIADTNTEPNDDIETIRRPRATVDECFDYILGLMESVLFEEDGAEATLLSDDTQESFLGQIDRTIAKALYAKAWVLRASPLFNGNTDFVAFKNKEGVNYFNQTENPEYWQKAYDAVNAAIAAAEKKGKAMYTYTDLYPYADEENVKTSGVMKHAYDNRYSIVDPWNKEIVWGNSNYGTGQTVNGESQGGALYVASQIRSTADAAATYCFQWLAVTLNCCKTFYTKNGVPITEDVTWYPESEWFNLTTMPNDDYHLGYVQPGEETVNFHLNREPRYYAWILFDRAKYRAYQKIMDVKMRSGEEPGGNKGHTTDYLWSGIGCKKLIHPNSDHTAEVRIVRHPFPMIRMADLYLLRAECANEVSGPSAAVYADINKVRSRAGLRNVEDVYSDSSIVGANAGNHTVKESLRKIIHTERMIELMFEGQQYLDVRRWKRGEELFNDPVEGFNAPDGSTAASFNEVVTWQTHTFISPKSYLNPIPQSEIDRNPNVDQNPGY